MYPDAPILLAGYSMGAMLVAKYLAEARYNSAASGGAPTHAPCIFHATFSMCSELLVSQFGHPSPGQACLQAIVGRGIFDVAVCQVWIRLTVECLDLC